MKIEVAISGIEPERRYTVAEVRRFLNRSESWVRNLIMEGRIPSEKIGVARIVKGKHLIDYLRDDLYADADEIVVNRAHA